MISIDLSFYQTNQGLIFDHIEEATLHYFNMEGLKEAVRKNKEILVNLKLRNIGKQEIVNKQNNPHKA